MTVSNRLWKEVNSLQINITYPKPKKVRKNTAFIMGVMRKAVILAGLASVIVNLAVRGVAWSAVVVWSLYMLWKLVLAPDMVEYNRISQISRIIIQSCILLVIIDFFIVKFAAVNIVLLVCFGGLIASLLLLYTDFNKQRHNVLPLVKLSTLSLVASATLLVLFWNTDAPEKTIWQLPVTCVLSVAEIIICIMVMRGTLRNKLKMIFHTK